MTETAFPLQWPEGRPRTKARRETGFKVTPRAAFEEMIEEVVRMRGRGLVVSSNAPLRRDGTPYADALDYRLPDPGVAIYFTRKSRRVCISCDTYTFPWENMRAIGKTVEALRSIAHWGAEEMLDQAFTGFTALPPPGRHWSEVLGVPRDAAEPAVQAAYKVRAKDAAQRDDQAGLSEINVARDKAVGEIRAR